ncbi:HNH endonuclease signature motif containing protein [Agrococcus sp. HG114]|uniref:HNH endonuclease signature motif containing protein n=1 Tax=Agrococcus sp. HG114 TaxID=2969757 RepID=UPI00215ABB93|nr:HNH endonuclease signature motif containing protein [Agrococcus sp. HG114]MCR8669603.1 HNH endonuclease [Agrococcus sp. HG114]
MDAFGLDGEEYIAAVRAGTIDPFGSSADELQESLDDFDRAMSERLRALSDEQIDEIARTGAAIPRVTEPPRSDAAERLRLDQEFVGRMRAIEARSARIEGERRALMASHLQRVIDMAGDSGPRVKELAMITAVELGLTGGGVARRMTDAWTIVTELPAAHEAAASGRITTAHLSVIEGETRALRLDADVAAEERTRVIDELVAVAESVSTAQLRARAKRIVNHALTRPLQIRHETARQQRRVQIFDAGDGMADLVARIPALEAAAIHDRLTQAARKKPKDDSRTYDQFRADALQEVLLAGVVPDDLHGVSPITAHISIAIPATELLHGADGQDPALRAVDFPASLDGKVLVDRESARRIAGDTAVWERLFTDPVSGVPVTVDAYRASAAQRRWLRARDGRCRGPGCAKPVMRTDLDHTNDFAKGGSTSLDNLEHLCRSDHGLKHDTRWSVEQLPGGALRWTSPIGQVIDDIVEPAGPTFTDVPRSRPKPPKRTRSERVRDYREAVERLERPAAERSGRDSPPPAPLDAGHWRGLLGESDAPRDRRTPRAEAEPAPF